VIGAALLNCQANLPKRAASDPSIYGKLSAGYKRRAAEALNTVDMASPSSSDDDGKEPVTDIPHADVISMDEALRLQPEEAPTGQLPSLPADTVQQLAQSLQPLAQSMEPLAQSLQSLAESLQSVAHAVQSQQPSEPSQPSQPQSPEEKFAVNKTAEITAGVFLPPIKEEMRQPYENQPVAVRNLTARRLGKRAVCIMFLVTAILSILGFFYRKC